ncbi:MAG TPA: F0F1 ATP synthase subunit alpha, partial [Clostridia bacterium]|nr:F0F1 ATP synthase subunit alpha [Clostridia bacterium]
AAFAQFGSDLDKATQATLARGERMVEVLKQEQYAPMPVEEQVVILFTAVNGFLDDLPVDRVLPFEKEFLVYLRKGKMDLLDEIKTRRELSETTIAGLKEAIEDFKKSFTASS